MGRRRAVTSDYGRTRETTGDEIRRRTENGATAGGERQAGPGGAAAARAAAAPGGLQKSALRKCNRATGTDAGRGKEAPLVFFPLSTK